jgi:transposase
MALHLRLREDNTVATAHLPDEFFDLVAHHLPPEPSRTGPKGGRPWVSHRVAVRAIWFVLVTGCRWEDVPRELGCSGRTAHRRLRAWEELGVWDRVHADLLGLLKRAGKLDADTAVVDGVIVRAFGGGAGTGPSPVDRRKPGTKYTLLVDRRGVPLAVRPAGANASDHTQLVPTLLAFPTVKGTPGRPKTRPDKVYADRGYDSAAARGLLRWLGIEPKIAKRGQAHGSGLGRVRWVVERTISWLKGLRRLRVRYDRSAVIRDAWTSVAASVICYRILNDEVPLAA